MKKRSNHRRTPRIIERERPLMETRAMSAKRLEQLSGSFQELWRDLFTSPVHLDSALSKRPPATKSLLAQILPTLLLRPVSTAEAAGIGVPEGEPWSLDAQALSGWRPAALMAERVYEYLPQGGIQVDSTPEDFPSSMLEEWKADWPRTWKRLTAVLGQEAPLSLRFNRRFPREQALKAFKQSLPVQAVLSELSPRGVRLSGYAPVLSQEPGKEWYEQGAFEIQDEGSQLMSCFALWPELYAQALSPEPGAELKPDLKLPALPSKVPAWNVVDACAGAGGKTLALADALQGGGRIFAYDTSEKKLQALKRRAKRAGWNNVQTVALPRDDEAKTVQAFRSRAQVVLVDAPCSGWGVLRRNPDIKWRQSRETLQKMPEIQARLLSLYSQLVAPGGRLVYGVCTFRRAETQAIVERFEEEHPEFKRGPGGYLGPGPTDGFFMQSWEREA